MHKMARQGRKRGELLWPRMIMKKWLNSDSIPDEFSADEHEDTDESESECENEDTKSSEMSSNHPLSRNYERKNDTRSLNSPWNCTNRNRISPEEALKRPGGGLWRGQSFTLKREYTNKEEFRIAVCTWNVAGKMPPPELELKDLLGTNDPADIYVIGFQEIVPLNAGNVFGSEDTGPNLKWQSLIRETLNKAREKTFTSRSAPPSPSRDQMESDSSDLLLGNGDLDAEHILIDEETSFMDAGQVPFKSKMEHDDARGEEPNLVKVYRSTERIGLKSTLSIHRTESEPMNLQSFGSFKKNRDEGYLAGHALLQASRALTSPIKKRRIRYVRIASKQMVGIQISVWVRRKLRQYITNLTVSCVGLGLMGCMGNKGSISVSLNLHETKFCFVCTHLTSGGKEGDELRRNADVTEILKRTRFPSMRAKTIRTHDRVIWLGDLNYRLNMSDSETRFLVAREDWAALLKKDQLKKELQRGGKFDGWQEGPISFPPTYKYKMNSIEYAGENSKSGEKRRTPAW